MSVFEEREKPEKNTGRKPENQRQTERSYGVHSRRDSNPGHIAAKRQLSPLSRFWLSNVFR